MNRLQSLRDYEAYIYTLAQQHPTVQRSSLTVIRRGAMAAVLRGSVEFSGGYRLVVREKLSFSYSAGEIKSYGYEV